VPVPEPIIAAVRRQDWAAVHTALAGRAPDDLAPVEVVLAADAAWWLTHLDESLRFRQRAYAAFAGANEHTRAAMCAWYLWFDYRFKGDAAVASGWLTRAIRHAEQVPVSREAGLVTLARAETARVAGDCDTAYDLADEARLLGLRIASADLVALATTTQGEVAIARGATFEGMARLDDAMCSVIDGELSPLVTGIVYCSVLTACFELADLRRAGEWTKAAIAWCESMPSGSPYHGICRVHRVEVVTLQGAWGDAEREAARAATELAALAPGAAGEAWYAMGEVRRRRGDLDGSEDAFVRAHELGRTPQPGLALLRLGQGRTGDAAALLRLDPIDLPSAPLPRALVLDAQIEIAIATGDVATARRAADALAAFADAGTAPSVVRGFAALAAAQVALAAGDCDGAVPLARDASETFRAVALPYEAARSRVVLGQAMTATGDADGGRLELAAARRAFDDLGAVLDAARLGAGRLGAGEPPRPRGLTDRELEVLRHLAAGRTNREIAQELCLSEHTVGRHVQNIFAKIDVSSRAAATAFAYRSELV
jgi:DNA-binding CsgD family transcriptional regulator